MSVYTNQTNVAPGTSAYITRTEVITAFSTIAGDLSGVNWNDILYNPNPLVSSLTVNANGIISGAGSLVVNESVNVSTASLRYINPLTGGGVQFAFTDQFANYLPVATGGFYAQAGGTSGNSYKVRVSPNEIYGQTSANVAQTLAAYNPGAPANQWSLSNISTINGSPPAGGTTFTSLTGTNLTTTGMLTSPQVVSVSSINGAAYANAIQAQYAGSNSVVVPSASPTTAISITTTPGTLAANEAYIYDVPVVLGAFPPSPTAFQLVMGVRLGGNGQINYSLPYWVAANSVNPIPINLTGIANTNQTSLGNNNIDVIFIQQSGSTWTVPVYSPPSAGGVNTWTIKLLD